MLRRSIAGYGFCSETDVLLSVSVPGDTPVRCNLPVDGRKAAIIGFLRAMQNRL